MKITIFGLLFVVATASVYAGALPGSKAREKIREVVIQNNTTNNHMRQYRGDRGEMHKQYRNTQRENARQYRNDQRERMSQY